MTDESHYATLGIEAGASAEAVRRAFRAGVLRCHPDLHPGDPTAAARFRAIKAAADALLRAATHAQPDACQTGPEASTLGIPQLDGYDVVYEVHVSQYEAAYGKIHRMMFHQPDGVIYHVDVPVPAGIANGQRVRIAGAGGPSRSGRRRGDLYLVVKILDE